MVPLTIDDYRAALLHLRAEVAQLLHHWQAYGNSGGFDYSIGRLAEVMERQRPFVEAHRQERPEPNMSRIMGG